MAHSPNTEFKSNTEASEIHYLLGSRCYSCDLDYVEMSIGSMEGPFMEIGKGHCVAFIDWKQGLAQDIPCRQNKWAITQQARFATEEMKEPTPFFIVLTYLLPIPEYPEKMYFVLPGNKVARKKIPLPGQWMTLFTMSKFQHFLRGIIKSFDPEEVITQNRLLVKYGFPIGMKLGELPNKRVEYELPNIDYDFLATL